ncbi:hypothetical protein EBZ38_05630 [bacterium]|nr:hypothetical protein [bacterium]
MYHNSLVALTFVAVATFIHVCSMEHTWERGHRHYMDNDFKLYDVVHSNTPDMSMYSQVKDFYALLFLVPIFLSPPPGDFYREFFIKQSVLVIIRSIMIFCTVLPKGKQCTRENKTLINSCYDKIFSGHFSFGLLITLLLFKYGVLQNTETNYITFAILNVFHFFILTVTRSHYTIDTLVSLFMTLFVFGLNGN